MISSKVKAQWSAVLRRVEMQNRAVVVEAGTAHRAAAVIVSPEWFERAVTAIGEPTGGIERGAK